MDVSERALASVKRIVLDHVRDYPVDVYLFGSRARRDANDLSDIDVALLPRGEFPIGVLSRLQEALEESTVPYRVDVVDLRQTSAAFRARVLQEGVQWAG